MISKNIESFVGFLLPTIQDFVFLLVFVGVIVLGPRMMNIDGDLGRHLTIGEYILTTRTIPTEDFFSHTMTGESLTPHEWLSQVVFAALYRAGGLNLVVWGCGVILATSFALLYRICWQLSGSNLISVGIVFLGIFASSLHWLTRPHLFTILFLVIWLGILFQIRAGWNTRWRILPIIMLLWVNFHGAYIAGVFTLLIFVSGMLWDRWIIQNGNEQEYRPWIFGLVSSIFVIGLNPSGYRVLETSIGYLQNRYLVSHTAEYLPPNFHDPSTWPFLIMLIFVIFLFGAQKSRVLGPLLFLAAAWSAMALYSTRNIPLFVIAAAPSLAVAGSELLQLPVFKKMTTFESRIATIQVRLNGWLLPLLLVCVTGLLFAVRPNIWGDRNRFHEAVFPVQAVDWLENNPQHGNMFNYFPWGGYLLYRLWPAENVFIDGQTDFYGEALTRQYEQVLTLQPGWESVLLAYRVSWVIMPSESNITDQLIADDNWNLIYEDKTAVIFRNTDQN